MAGKMKFLSVSPEEITKFERVDLGKKIRPHQ